MTNEELILQKLDSLELTLAEKIDTVNALIEKLNNRLNKHGEKLIDFEVRQKELTAIAQKHDAEIQHLKELMDDLAKDRSNVIWESKNGSRLALKREPVYDLFDSLGIPRNYALTLLDAGRKLCVECSRKSFNHTKNVRIKGGPVTRAIVILTE